MNIIKAAKDHYYRSLILLAQAQDVDVGLTGPNVVVQPAEPIIDKAIKIIKRKEPNAFSGVRTINVGTGQGALGFVESGLNKDPAVINIDANLIKNKASNFDPSVSEFLNQMANPEEARKVFWTTVTLYHEVAHVKDYDEQQGFPGGEGVAEAAERDIINWINQNVGMLKDLFV